MPHSGCGNKKGIYARLQRQLSCVIIGRRNMKNTKLFKGLTSLFNRYSRPLTVNEIRSSLHVLGLDPNKTTVYRQLEKMEAGNLIQKVMISDKQQSYEKKGGHHHHLVCVSCDKIDDIILSEKNLIKSLILPKKFVPLSHSLEIFGRCASCAK